MAALTRWIIRYAGWVAAFGAILSILAGFFTVRLYGDLRTDLEELLPSKARSVQDLNEIRRRLPTSTNLAVLAFSKDTEGSKRFIDDLATKLGTRNGLVSRVEYRIDREIDFFQKRRALFISVDDLGRIRDYVRARLDYERELHNPLNIFSEVAIAQPHLDFNGLEAGYSKPLLSFLRFPGGYYANPDQTIRVALIYMNGDASDIARAHQLRKQVDDAIAGLGPSNYAPDLTIRYTGDIENILEEQASLVSDLKASAAIVMILVALALAVFFRDFAGTLSLVTSLLMGTLWTFGLAYFLVGYLNANSAFLGSIVLGNGINFGIILLARYLENRRAGLHLSFALVGATQSTKIATLLAALSAGLSYGALMLTPFRGFRQFGFIGLIGMILCWISAYTMQPALLTLLERFRGHTPRGHGHRLAKVAATLDQRYFKTIATLSLLLAILASISIVTYRGKLIETNTLKLRDRRSLEHGSGYYSRYLDEIFGRYLSPLIVLPRTHDQSLEIRAQLKDFTRSPANRIGNKRMIAAVYSEDDFIPKSQPEKIRILRQIRELIPRRLLHELSPADQQRIRQFFQPEAFHPFGPKDLPSSILQRFREKDGSFGKLVLVEPVIDQSIINDGDNQTILLNTVRGIVDAISPGAPIAGQLPLTAEMYHAVRTQGPKATAVAFLAVVLLVIVLFRHLKTITLALTALLLGVLWFFGFMLAVNLKINFLNFIALPITFGIGVDYGVNIFQRYRIEGRGSIAHVIGNTGGAVALASLTTCIGYGSLLLAGSQAFVSFGEVAMLGEITCAAAAIISLPSFLVLLDRHEQQGAEPEEERKAG